MVRETIVECVKWETNSDPNCAVARLSYLQSRDLYDLAFHNIGPSHSGPTPPLGVAASKTHCSLEWLPDTVTISLGMQD
jgi:hypothetical protein